MATPGVPTRWALMVRDDNNDLRVAGLYQATPEIKDSFIAQGGPWYEQEYPAGSGIRRRVVRVEEDEHDPANGRRARAGIGMRYRPAANVYEDPPARRLTESERAARRLEARLAQLEQFAGVTPPEVPEEEAAQAAALRGPTT